MGKELEKYFSEYTKIQQDKGGPLPIVTERNLTGNGILALAQEVIRERHFGIYPKTVKNGDSSWMSITITTCPTPILVGEGKEANYVLHGTGIYSGKKKPNLPDYIKLFDISSVRIIPLWINNSLLSPMYDIDSAGDVKFKSKKTTDPAHAMAIEDILNQFRAAPK